MKEATSTQPLPIGIIQSPISIQQILVKIIPAHLPVLEQVAPGEKTSNQVST